MKHNISLAWALRAPKSLQGRKGQYWLVDFRLVGTAVARVR